MGNVLSLFFQNFCQNYSLIVFRIFCAKKERQSTVLFFEFLQFCEQFFFLF